MMPRMNLSLFSIYREVSLREGCLGVSVTIETWYPDIVHLATVLLDLFLRVFGLPMILMYKLIQRHGNQPVPVQKWCLARGFECYLQNSIDGKHTAIGKVPVLSVLQKCVDKFDAFSPPPY